MLNQRAPGSIREVARQCQRGQGVANMLAVPATRPAALGCVGPPSSSGPMCAGRRSTACHTAVNSAGSAAPPIRGSNVSAVYTGGDLVEVGRIMGAHGIHGEVKVQLLTDSPQQRLAPGKRLFLRPPPGKGVLSKAQDKDILLRQVTTVSSKVRMLAKGEESWIVQFKEATQREQAESLLGHTLLVAAADRSALRDPDEFYAQELVGCRAFLQSGVYVGTVVDLISGTGSHDTLLLQLRPTKDDIEQSKMRTCMVPFVKAMCPTVDRSRREMVLNPPEGLLDLVVVKDLRKPLMPEQQIKRLKELELIAEQDKARAQQVKESGSWLAAGVASSEAQVDYVPEGDQEEGPVQQQRQRGQAAPTTSGRQGDGSQPGAGSQEARPRKVGRIRAPTSPAAKRSPLGAARRRAAAAAKQEQSGDGDDGSE